MSIHQTIREDRLKKDADRTILSVIMNEIVIDGKPIDDKAAIKKISGMRKGVINNIKIYKKANKTEQLESENNYLKCIENYLPKGATEEQITEFIEQNDIKRDIKSMKVVMQSLKKNFDIVDGALVKQVLLN